MRGSIDWSRCDQFSLQLHRWGDDLGDGSNGKPTGGEPNSCALKAVESHSRHRAIAWSLRKSEEACRHQKQWWREQVVVSLLRGSNTKMPQFLQRFWWKLMSLGEQILANVIEKRFFRRKKIHHWDPSFVIRKSFRKLVPNSWFASHFVGIQRRRGSLVRAGQ